jgi:small-conductance mechanosensitive channel
MSWLDTVVYGNTLTEWLMGVGAGALAVLAVRLAERVLRSRLAKHARQAGTPVAALIAGISDSTGWMLALAAALFVGGQILSLPPRPERIVNALAMVGLWLQAAVWANRGINDWLRHRIRAKQAVDAAGATTMGVLGFLARLAVWSLVILLILSNLGFDITALVASLGVGGIAVALAVQTILGDIFASLSIVLDKPFVVGDFIVVDQIMGTVEYIGLKTTRLRSLSGEQIVVSNADLLSSRIRNYKRMAERRVIFSVGVVYRTPPATLERIPNIVRQCIEALPDTRFDRAHFQSFGDSALIFEIAYYVLNADYNVYMDVQQAINLGIFRAFAAEGIEFAYPTRTLYMQPAAAAP